eukprot:jgi/Pico_ML_1/53154/g3756.t1
MKTRKVKENKKKDYTPFPPPQQPRKEDLAMETGEYFLAPKEKKWHAKQDKLEKQSTKVAEKKKKREEAFVPPKEEKSKDVIVEESMSFTLLGSMGRTTSCKTRFSTSLAFSSKCKTYTFLG